MTATAGSLPAPGGRTPLAGASPARIGYGAMQLEHAEPADARALLRTARELGVDHLDTAEFYPGVNARIAEALAPAGLLLATKIGADRDAEGRLRAAQRPRELRDQVHANLRSLGVPRLDLVYLRRLDTPPGILATGEERVDLDLQLAELTALREEGLIGAIGLSNVSVAQLRTALPAGIAAVQNRYDLISREEEPVLSLCREENVAFVPYFPLGSGFDAGDKPVEHPEVRKVAAELDATPAQVALAWLLAHDPGILLIPGTRTLAHLRENLAAGALELPAAARARLDAVGRL